MHRISKTKSSQKGKKVEGKEESYKVSALRQMQFARGERREISKR